MNKWLEILIGLILLIIPILIAIIFTSWGTATIAFLKGGVICFVALIGLLFLMLGLSDLRE
jgi:hypothetical protein